METAIADAKAAAEKFSTDATDADAALKAELEAAINTAVTETKAYVDAQVAELKKVDDANKADLAEAIATLNKNIADAKAAAEKIAADAATAADAALKAELEKSIADAKAAAEAKWGDWNDATEVVIEKIAALRIAYNHFVKTYENILSDVVMDKATAIVAETETKLLRAVNKKAAEEVYVYAGDFFATIDGIFEVFATYNMEYYYAAEQAALKLAFETALQAVVDSTSETNVPAIKTALEAELGAVPNKAKVIEDKLTAKGTDIVMVVTLNAEWDKLLQEVDAMIEAETEEIYKALNMADVDVLYGEYKVRYDLLVKLKGLFEGRASDAKQLTTYLKDKENAFSSEIVNKCLSLYADVDNWLALLGETNEENMKMVDATAFADLKTIYEARKQAHIDYVKNTLYPALVMYGANYTYLYNEEDATEKEAIYKLYSDYNEFEKHLVKVGFIDDLNEDLKAAYDVFAKGAYARAKAIDQAKIDSDAIDTQVENFTVILTAMLENKTPFKSQYQVEMEDINAAVKLWKDTYFAGSFAEEMTADNANYALLNHAAYADLCDLYDKNLGNIVAAIKDVAEKFAAPGFVTINLLSADEIAASKASWETLLDKVADLGLETMGMDIGAITGIDGDATVAKIADLLDKKTLEYKAACAAAASEYDKLNATLTATSVTIYDEADVAAIVAWYNKFIGIDAKDATSELPADGKNLELSATVTITDELYASVKATYAAWDLLTTEKTKEMDDLNKDIAEFLEGTINTESRAAYNALKERLNAYLEGDGAIALGYNKSQYNIDFEIDLYVIDDSGLAAAGKKILALEKQRDELFARLDALTTTDAKNALLDATKATENDAMIDALEADMDAFTKENAYFNCFVVSAGTTYTNREIIIDQSRAIIDIAVIYADAIKNVELIVTEAVKADLKDRAIAARDAAVELILTLDVEAWASSDEFKIELAKLSVVKETIDLYLEYAPIKGEVAVAERYENSVISLIVNRISVERLGDDVNVLIADTVATIENVFAEIIVNLP